MKNSHIKRESSEFIMGISQVDQLISWMTQLQEKKGVVFSGRSNVGKSSLINSIFRNDLCRVSNTPGRTREINFFKFNTSQTEETYYLVDLPGYGYAKVSKDMSSQWDHLLATFFELLPKTFMVIQIQDSRHMMEESDKSFLKFYRQFHHKNLSIVFNKIDKFKKQSEKSELKNDLKKIHEKYTYLKKTFTSSTISKEGIDIISNSIVTHLGES